MAKIEFSKDQLSIINSRDENVLVAAAAGSGKTAVLVERIIRRITDEKNPVDIDRLLVVTFTNAAAAEMKERILKALDEKLLNDPQNEHLSRQATLVHNAMIMTIDSFCLYLVRNHFNQIDLDPSFRIAGESEIKLLKQDVVKEVISRAYEKGDKEFYNLVDSYSGKSDDTKLEDSILKLYQFAMSYPWPKKWIDSHRNDYYFNTCEEFEKSDVCKAICRDIENEARVHLELLNEALQICDRGPVEYQKTIQPEKDTCEKVLKEAENESFKGIGEAFLKYQKVDLAKKASGTEDEKLKVKAIRDKCRKIREKLEANYFSFAIETQLQDMREAGINVNRLFDLTIDFMDSFDAAKRERAILDFTDMEHMAISILIEEFNSMDDYKITDVAKGYRDYFEEIMIDEYQDANLVQEILLKSVSREDADRGNNRFMVGDVKQSIYKFRLARPQIFTGKRTYYASKVKEANRAITLSENYRSRKSVIDSINAVFEDIMTEDMAGLKYDEGERLNAKASYPTEDMAVNKSEFIIVERPENSDKDIQVKAIAQRITELVGDMEIYDKENKIMRKAGFGDVAVLYRSQDTVINDLCDCFEEMNIPYHMIGKGAFYNTREIQEIMNLLRVLDNPLDDISLYGLMVSYFGGLSDEDGARIVAEAPKDLFYLWDKLMCYRENHGDDERVEKLINMINTYREMSIYTPIASLVSKILNETDYLLYVSAMKDGERRLANVKMLIGKAKEYEGTSFHGLFHFLRYIELMKKLDVDEGEADVAGDLTNTVKLMTIHKSKGLEFPICFVINLSKKLNTMDQSATFASDIDRGIGAKFIDPQKRIKRDTIIRKYVSNKIAKEDLAEEIRILYVAMTRAREKLIMTAEVNNYGKYEKTADSIGTQNYLALVSPGIRSHQDLFDIRTITMEDIGVGAAKEMLTLREKRLSFENSVASDEILELEKKLKERMVFDYKYKNLENLYTKTTVSELKIQALEEEVGESHSPFRQPEREEPIPAFMGTGEEVSGTDRGTAYHKLLSLIDFKERPENMESLKAMSDKLINAGKMSKEEVELIPLKKILTFLESDVAKEMQASDKKGGLFKEQPFVLGMTADSVNSEFPEDETILVQGVIDVFYEDENGCVVLDYKTDRVDEPDELVTRYKTQLDYYKAALERLTGKTVYKTLIYSFGLNRTIVVK